MTRRCRHHWTCSRWTPDGDPAVIRCSRCGDYASLGTARGTPETEIELRALDIGEKHGWKFGVDRLDYCPLTKSDELCDLCQAHHLAREIAEHDDRGAP